MVVHNVDSEGETALIKNAGNGRFYNVEQLIKFGADVNIKNNYGWTAIMRAAAKGHVSIVEKLINSGACDLSSAWAVVNESNIPMLYLFDKNIINQVDNLGNTTLMKACEEINETNVLFLYEKGADFFVENTQGQSAFDFLMAHNELPEKLLALKEQLLLSKEIDDQCERGFSL